MADHVTRDERAVGSWIAAGAALLVLAPAAHADDAPAYALIETLRPLAAAIAIDGQDADWAGIPAFPDASGDAGGDATRDITSVSIAPTDDALRVRIATAGAPSTVDLAFWLYVDFVAQERIDLELGLYLGFPDILWVYPEGQAATFQNWDHTTTVVGNVVELRIPYAQLDAALPASMQGRLSGAAARPFLRVFPYTVDIFSNQVVDQGAAVASYRLVPTPYALDPALPAGAEDARGIRSPLSGSWYVGQGAFGIGTHAGYWGYDLHLVDAALNPDAPHPGTVNTDFPSFGQPIAAPAAGSVFSMENAQPDLPPNSGPITSPPNFVFLELGGEVGLLFSHLKQGTIALAQGQALGPGAPLGQVGHSGSSSWPHLHLEAQDIANGFESLPLAIRNAEVRLNPVSNDPWLRHVPVWGIREGMFVANGTEAVPALGAGALAALGATLALGAAVALRRRA
jgi:murein DD-endopeptidase MepM/ murein hydrolase activator NlpD